jgi:hypothetical protein
VSGRSARRARALKRTRAETETTKWSTVWQRFPRRLGRRARVCLSVLLAVVCIALYLIGSDISEPQRVELNLRAGQGDTKIALATERKATSPGCGCLDPAFGQLPWFGMSIPSEGFDLSVSSDSGHNVDTARWALTAMAPDIGPVNWYGVPTHSLKMQVIVHRNGRAKTIFNSRTVHFVVITDKPVRVRQPQRYPYTALIPAAGGESEFRIHPASRPQWGGVVDAETDAPARGSAGRIFRGNYSAPRLTERGPMIDVLGPVVRFELDASSANRIWAGNKRLLGLSSKDQVEIRMTTPFSLRLIAHPVQLDWLADMRTQWARVRELAAKGRRQYQNDLALGPLAQGRFVLSEPLPSYVVHLHQLLIPDPAIWRSFAQRSIRKVAISPMLSQGSMDRGHLVVGQYGLPPVPTKSEIGVFGSVTHFASDAQNGEIVGGSKLTPIARGEELAIDSHDGLDAGLDQFTPLVSTGQATGFANISGTAAVRIDDVPLLHAPWVPWLPGAIAAALVGLLIERLVRWISHGHREGTADLNESNGQKPNR